MSFSKELFQMPFSEIISYIDEKYTHHPAAFTNGGFFNQANENQGSARIFYFARLNRLSEADTLKLFAEHYQAVIEDPAGSSHQNIRNFMKHGWEGIEFHGTVLENK